MGVMTASMALAQSPASLIFLPAWPHFHTTESAYVPFPQLQLNYIHDRMYRLPRFMTRLGFLCGRM